MLKVDSDSVMRAFRNGNLPTLEGYLEIECNIAKDEIPQIIEYMYRILLMSYEPSNRENGVKVGEIAAKLRNIDINPDLLECNVIYDEFGGSAGIRKLSNKLYLLSPSEVNFDFSDHGVGDFAQLRVNLLSGWYPD